MTINEHVRAVEVAYVAKVWKPRTEVMAARALIDLRARRVADLLAAIPSKRQYRRMMGRVDQAPTTDRRMLRLMRRDVNVRDAVGIVRRWPAQLVEYARRRQDEEYSDALLVRAVAFDAATDARIRLRVTSAELAVARGMLIAGRRLDELLRAAAGRLAGRVVNIPREVAANVRRYATPMEVAIRRAARGALDRFAREVTMLLADYWYGAVQYAWSRPLAVKGVKR